MKNNIISTCCDSECWSKNWNSFNEEGDLALLDFDFENGRIGNFADYHQRDSGALQRNSSGEWVYAPNVLNPYSNECFQVSGGNYVSGTIAGASSEMAWSVLSGAGPNGEDVVELQTGVKHIDGTALSPVYAQFYHPGPNGPHVGKTFRFRVVAKGNIGETVNVNIDYNGVSEDSGVQFTFDGTWQTFEIEHTFENSSSAQLTGRIGIRGVNAAGGGSTGSANAASFQVAEYNIAQVSPGQSMDPVRSEDSAPLYLPRLDHYDPITGRRGYLREPQATNLLPYSNDFSNAQWSKQGTASITSTDQPSPDGGDSASTLTDADNIAWGTGNMLYGGGTSIAPNTDYVFSLYIRKTPGSSTTTAAIGIRDNWSGAFPKESFMVTDEWQRVSVAHTTAGTVNSLGTHIGNADGDVDIWNAQLEEGAVPSSPVFTNGSTVTRQADTESTITLSKGATKAATVIMDGAVVANTGSASVVFSELSDGGSSNQIRLDQRINVIQSLRGVLLENSNANVVTFTPWPALGESFKLGFSVDSIAGNRRGALNGSSVQNVSITPWAWPSPLNEFNFSDSQLGLVVYRLQILDKSTSMTQLQSLTTL